MLAVLKHRPDYRMSNIQSCPWRAPFFWPEGGRGKGEARLKNTTKAAATLASFLARHISPGSEMISPSSSNDNILQHLITLVIESKVFTLQFLLQEWRRSCGQGACIPNFILALYNDTTDTECRNIQTVSKIPSDYQGNMAIIVSILSCSYIIWDEERGPCLWSTISHKLEQVWTRVGKNKTLW